MCGGLPITTMPMPGSTARATAPPPRRGRPRMPEHGPYASRRIARPALRLAALLAAAWFAAPVAAGASPALRSGDVVEITVAGVPALTRRTMVGPDGRIAYPV